MEICHQIKNIVEFIFHLMYDLEIKNLFSLEPVMNAPFNPTHIQPNIIQCTESMNFVTPACDFQNESFIANAAAHIAQLPDAVRRAIADFHQKPHKSGALLIKGLPVGQLPDTPATPTTPTAKDCTSELTLLTVAKALGEPIGYEPELGGRIIQNILPTKTASTRQVSTSSKVSLMFHTEAAFHPHRPAYLLLLCLKGDPAASTTLASIREVLPLLSSSTVEILFQARFRTAVDESYLHGRANTLGEPVPVLSGALECPSMVFDADLMVGTDDAAQNALAELSRAVANCHTGVCLEAGDLLIVDNAVAVHGRSPFTPRFDGTDRWLQRTFVVADLAASADERVGRVISTEFGL